MPTAEWNIPDGYAALRDAVAWYDGGQRTAIWVVGEDAVRFVDGFTTASLAGLAPGQGAEGFFPDARGQVLAFATIFRAADGVWIDADPPTVGDATPAGWSLAGHLDRYHIRERLRIVDRSAEIATVVVAGPAAAGRLAGDAACRIPSPSLAHDLEHLEPCLSGAFTGRCAGIPAVVARGEWAGPDSFLIVVASGDRERLAASLNAAGIPAASTAAVDAVRREEGRPMSIDIPARTLPQELGRDQRAISFRKGCYLGQETVARLDAIGHVNRRLVGIVTPRDVPLRAGMPVLDGGGDDELGRITSAGPSPRFDGWLGLAVVRIAALEQRAGLTVAGAPARSVPMPSSTS